VVITVPFSFVLTVSDASSQFSFPLDKRSLTSNKYINVLQNETNINGLSDTNLNEKSSLIVKTINERSLDTTVHGLLDIHDNLNDNAQRTQNRGRKRDDDKERTR